MKIYSVQILSGILFLTELITHGATGFATFFSFMFFFSSGFNAYVEWRER